MPDIGLSIPASQLPAVDLALGGLFPLQPPPTPKGRYALAKVANVVGPAHQTYQEQKNALLLKHAVRDAEDKPITRETTLNGQPATQYDLGAGFGNVTPAYLADLKDLNEEPITLTGCRRITHAELGACPITVQMETALIAAGLLEDSEPV